MQYLLFASMTIQFCFLPWLLFGTLLPLLPGPEESPKGKGKQKGKGKAHAQKPAEVLFPDLPIKDPRRP